MSAVVADIAPVFVLIALGFALRRSGWPGEALWSPAERLTYFVLLPALLLRILAEARFANLDVLPMMGALVGSVFVVAGLLVVARPRLSIAGPGLTSLFQTLGINHQSYNALIRIGADTLIAIIVIGNCSIPILVLAGVVGLPAGE